MLIDIENIKLDFERFRAVSNLFFPQEHVRPWKTDVFSVYIHITPKVSCHDRTQQNLVLSVLKQCPSVLTSRTCKTDVFSVCTHKYQLIL